MKQANLNNAVKLHQDNKLEEAIIEYLKLYKITPKDENLNLYIGTAYLQTKDYNQAEKYLKLTLTINNKNFHAFSNLGVIYKEKKDFKTALKYFQKSIKLNPNFEHAYNNIGNCYISLKEFVKAIEYYDKALSINPHSEFYFNKANALYTSGDLIRSVDILESMSQKNLLNEKAFTLYLKVLNSLGNFTKIDKLFNLYPKYLDNNDEIRTKLLDNLINLNQFSKIKKNIEKLSNPYSKNLYLGIYFFKIKEFDKALLIFNELSKNNNKFEIFNNLGLVYKEKSEFEQSKIFFSKALNILPNHSIARMNLGLIQLKDKIFDKGFKNYSLRHIFINPSLSNFIKDLPKLNIQNFEKDRVIVFPEQGIGDQILFLLSLNYPLSNFDFVVDSRLIETLKINFPLLSFFTIDSLPDIKNYDSYFFLADYFGEIINRCQINLITKPIKNINSKSGYHFNCGLSWKSANEDIGSSKSLPLEFIIKLLPQEIRTNLVNLQYGNVDEEIKNQNLNFDIKILNLDIDYFNNLNALLEVISSCKIVVTTSNITAHLSGWIGKKTYLICPLTCGRHWYWHSEKNCFWYPNTSVYFLDFQNPKISSDFIILKQDLSREV